MKKLFTVLLALCMTFSLAACGGGSNDATTETPNVGGGAASANSDNLIYGKVISVVGNEIELKVGTMPEIDLGEKEDDYIAQEVDGGLALAKRVDSPDEGGMELDYTGETIRVTISAGIPIMGMGQESTLSEIKTGTILGLEVEDTAAEALNIKEIQIIN